MLCLQVVNEEGNIVARGTEGNLAIRVKPDRPFSLFTEYLVSSFCSVLRGKIHFTLKLITDSILDHIMTEEISVRLN